MRTYFVSKEVGMHHAFDRRLAHGSGRVEREDSENGKGEEGWNGMGQAKGVVKKME